MLSALKFVQGAVAKKDFLPAMTHFEIKDGVVRSYNGSLALASPLPFNIDCKPAATPLVQAIACCSDTVSLSMTPAGRLRVHSGNFRAFIECHDGETPHVGPEGDEIQFDGEQLLSAIKAMAPFIGDDASRPWSNGIFFKDSSAFATNNVCLVEYWMGQPFPFPANIPLTAIKEMIRVAEAPTHGQLTDRSITFHYSDGRWIRSQLLATDWPDLGRILNREHNASKIDPRIFEAMVFLKPFADKMGRIFFSPDAAKTHNEESEGATYALDGFPFTGVFQMEMLKLLKNMQTIDFSTYPGPCLFFGDRIRGAIIGMRA